MKTEKPLILCSRCLGFDNCRYNGEIIPAPFIEKLSDFCRIINVCPEVEIGLGVPRKPVRIIKKGDNLRLIQTETLKDQTDKMNIFSAQFINNLREVHGFILKYKSPSCALKAAKYYPSTDKSPVSGKGPGLFGKAVLDAFPGYPAETETRLTNFNIREHFLTKLFTFSRFDSVRKESRIKQLIDFHAQNKLLLLAYNQKNMRLMGNILANQKEKGMDSTKEEYKILLLDSFKKNASHNSHINVIQHAMGYFSKKIKREEVSFITNLISEYKNNKIPLSALRMVIRSYIVRFDIEYLKSQSYFEPYPAELAEVSDSGKGRDLRHI